jgi:hypothetical protein
MSQRTHCDNPDCTNTQTALDPHQAWLHVQLNPFGRTGSWACLAAYVQAESAISPSCLVGTREGHVWCMRSLGCGCDCHISEACQHDYHAIVGVDYPCQGYIWRENLVASAMVPENALGRCLCDCHHSGETP